MTNIEFFNTISMIDGNMSDLHNSGVVRLIGYPNLQQDFHRLHKTNHFLGNLQVARLVIIEHEVNSKIAQNLKLLECISLELGQHELYMTWLNRELYRSNYEIRVVNGVEGNGIVLEFRTNLKEFHFGHAIVMKQVGSYMNVYEEGKGLVGTFTAWEGVKIRDGEAKFIVHNNSKHIKYTMAMGSQGMYVKKRSPHSLEMRKNGNEKYYGRVECFLKMWDFEKGSLHCYGGS